MDSIILLPLNCPKLTLLSTHPTKFPTTPNIFTPFLIFPATRFPLPANLGGVKGHYTTGDIWCAGDANLVPWNIRKGYNIFGVTGTFSGWVDPTSERVIWPIASGHAPVTKSPTWLYYNPTSIHPESIRTRMVSVRDIQPYITGWNRLEFALYTSVTNWWTVYFYHLNGSLINTSHGSASTDSTLHINITFANLGIVTSSLSRIDLEMDNAGFGIDTLRLRYFI